MVVLQGLIDSLSPFVLTLPKCSPFTESCETNIFTDDTEIEIACDLHTETIACIKANISKIIQKLLAR